MLQIFPVRTQLCQDNYFKQHKHKPPVIAPSMLSELPSAVLGCDAPCPETRGSPDDIRTWNARLLRWYSTSLFSHTDNTRPGEGIWQKTAARKLKIQECHGVNIRSDTFIFSLIIFHLTICHDILWDENKYFRKHTHGHTTIPSVGVRQLQRSFAVETSHPILPRQCPRLFHPPGKQDNY